MKSFGLYIHIPYCVKKCNYCDFASVGIGDCSQKTDEITGEIDCLIDAEISELKEYKDKLRGVSSIFIGGGTPSIVPVDQMEKLLSAIDEVARVTQRDGVEYTVEANPGTVDADKLKLYKKYGINRISFGLQSAIDTELKCLGRIHSFDDFINSFELARNVGFDNVNIDLMTAIPGQTTESLLQTLENVTKLEPEHISAYSLIIEEGTPFFEKYSDNPPIDEETDRKMFELVGEKLASTGYEHYEISNYAKPERRCKHNLNYWKRGDYVGIGPAAASHLSGTRTVNVSDTDEYIALVTDGKNPAKETEILTREQILTEEIYLGLRTSDGIDFSQLSEHYNIDLQSLWGDKLKELFALGLIKSAPDMGNNKLRLTQTGMWVSDTIIDKLLAQ